MATRKRKDRYRWFCTACGHEIERQPKSNTYKAGCAARDLLVELGAAHLRKCPTAGFEDVDGYYNAEACYHPYTRPVVRRVRKIAFMRVGRNKTLHIDYGAEHTPCGLEVENQDATEVSAVDFYSGKVAKLRLCNTCLAYRRPGIAEEMAVLEAQFARAG